MLPELNECFMLFDALEESPFILFYYFFNFAVKGCSFCRVKSSLQLERKLQKFLCFLAGEQCFLFTPQPCSSQEVSYKTSHLGFKEAQNNHFQAYFGFYMNT